jgi:quercetin dioxygenase-like cupin family protein
MDYKLSDIKPREIIPGYHGRLIHSRNMSLAFWEVEAGAEVPEHAHTNEQIMQVQEGQFEFTVGGNTRIYGPGELVVIPPEVPHSGRAITACRLMDIFSPVREEYQ